MNVYPQDLIPENHFFSTGIHPWYINENWENELKIIAKNLENSRCLALGECGIDKRIDVSLELQVQVFESQVQLAKKLKKPLILHCVAAFDEVLKVLSVQKFDHPVVFHGFSSNQIIANQLVKKGYYISFGKYLMLNEKLSSVFRNIDQNHFFLETDHSNFTISEVYAKATEIKNIAIEDIKNIVNYNFEKVFNYG